MYTILVTGHPKSGSGRIEIIKEDFKTKVCSNMPEYPLEIFNAAGSMRKNGKLSLCGGYSGSYRSECYTLENGKWTKNSDNLQSPRNGHGSSNIGNKIFMTGGVYNGQYLASTEIIHPDGKITQGPNLPQGRSTHCQISYEQTIFITGK